MTRLSDFDVVRRTVLHFCLRKQSARDPVAHSGEHFDRNHCAFAEAKVHFLHEAALFAIVSLYL